MELKERPYRSNLREIFLKGFNVMYIAEPLVSFDAEQPSAAVMTAMTACDFDLVGIRKNGRIAGYVRRDQMGGGPCGDSMREFRPAEVVLDTTPLLKVIPPLARGETLFVSILFSVGAVITPWDLQKPAVRMAVFGVVTLLEMGIARMIRNFFPEQTWMRRLSENRLRKAELLLNERQRRNEPADLLDCLQFGDKSDLVAKSRDMRELFGLDSKSQAEKVFSNLGVLRDNLAHGQYLQPRHLETIANIADVLEKSLGSLDPFGDNLRFRLQPER